MYEFVSVLNVRLTFGLGSQDNCACNDLKRISLLARRPHRDAWRAMQSTGQIPQTIYALSKYILFYSGMRHIRVMCVDSLQTRHSMSIKKRFGEKNCSARKILPFIRRTARAQIINRCKQNGRCAALFCLNAQFSNQQADAGQTNTYNMSNMQVLIFITKITTHFTFIFMLCSVHFDEPRRVFECAMHFSCMLDVDDSLENAFSFLYSRKSCSNFKRFWHAELNMKHIICVHCMHISWQ